MFCAFTLRVISGSDEMLSCCFAMLLSELSSVCLGVYTTLVTAVLAYRGQDSLGGRERRDHHFMLLRPGWPALSWTRWARFRLGPGPSGTSNGSCLGRRFVRSQLLTALWLAAHTAEATVM